MPRESAFQTRLNAEIKRRLPGVFITKNDANYRQGVPDWLILYRRRWAILEVKRKRPAESDYEPNQEYYLEHLNKMSFARCVYPENMEEVLDALEQALRPRRAARVS